MLQNLKYLKYYLGVLYNNWTENKVSYSQHQEDELINLLFPNGITSFIDIGANDGVLFSNTYKFAKKGASGLCIEPSKSSFRKLKLNHFFHPKVRCLEAAVSDFNGFLFITDEGYESTLSKVSKSISTNSYKVKSFTLDKILEEFSNFLNIDLLSVDVEGHEKEVFKGLNNCNFVAKIIVFESDKSKIDELLSISSLRFYEPILYNGLNTIVIHKNEKVTLPAKLPGGYKRW